MDIISIQSRVPSDITGNLAFSVYPPVIKHGFLENPSLTNHVPIETSIYSGFSIDAFDYRMVN